MPVITRRLAKLLESNKAKNKNKNIYHQKSKSVFEIENENRHDVIVKVLIINTFGVPSDVQDTIKDYLFFDKITSLTRLNRIMLCNDLKKGLKYSLCEYSSMFEISYRHESKISGQICPRCGGYGYVSRGHIFEELSKHVVCSCFDRRLLQRNNDEIYYANEVPLLFVPGSLYEFDEE